MRRRLATIGRFCRTWSRFIIPIGLVLAITFATMLAHWMQSVDVSDHDYLNPTSRAGIGGATLAGRLDAHGVTIVPTHEADTALHMAAAGNATLFVPAPALLNNDQLVHLGHLPSTTRVVLVAPDGSTLERAVLPITGVGAHWATLVAAPGCDMPPAESAGDAGIDGIEYTGSLRVSCYDGALAQTARTEDQVWLAGATDPFRNDRIGEHGNAALAVGLLDVHPRLIWLDIHQPEPATSPASQGPTDGGPADSGPAAQGGGPGASNDAGGSGSGSGGNSNQPQGSPSIESIFPAWLWAAVGLAALALIVSAFAAARRLGLPVVEPMPVAARLREAVEGRGRLYRAARQPAAALDVLRAAALHQLPGLLGLPPATPVGELIAVLSQRAGLARESVEQILRGDRPESNEELVASARRLDELMTLAADSAGHTRTHPHMPRTGPQ